ncbi:hypothetical protein SNEBB_005714 [Seison nebaliae]|nr:hypothetical protein SNEBB_005714 [Seison nebaliae]
MIENLIFLLSFFTRIDGSLNGWWGYGTGIDGPSYWGTINPSEWRLCSEGKRQSPINIDANSVIYDRHLSQLKFSYSQNNGNVSINIRNSGRGIIFQKSPSKNKLILQSDELSNKYEFSFIFLKQFGYDFPETGSEHRINNESFKLELQFIFKNQKRITEEQFVIISLLINENQNSTTTNIDQLLRHLTNVKYKNDYYQTNIENLHSFFTQSINITSLREYITYQGSLTWPNCEENVMWIFPNQQFYISEEIMEIVSKISNSDEKIPSLRIGRPLDRNTRRRLIRTNVKEKDKCHNNFYYRMSTN